MVLWCMLAPLRAFAEQFTGKVVGISDGDTLSVLREGKAVKVRLYLTFRTPSDTDPRIFQGAFLAQQCPAVSDCVKMLGKRRFENAGCAG